MAYCEFKKDDIIDLNKVEEIWSKNTRPVSIYINNPFCMGGYDGKNCRYCVHRGYPSPNDEEVESFYKYLIKLLEQYNKIIEDNEIKLVNFGGGTPTFIYAKYGIDAFKKFLSSIDVRIPNFKSIHKMMELHPAYLTEELLDVLHEYGFTTVMFCVQTFSEKILEKENRRFGEPGIWIDKLKNLRYYARELGINVAFDFITFWTANVDNDIYTLNEDLDILKEFEPDEFTISVMCQYKYGSGINIGYLYRGISIAVNRVFPTYINPEDSLLHPEVTAIRFYNPDNNSVLEDFNIYRNTMTDVGWEYEHGYSTLGLGCYKNQDKAVFSIIGPRYTIYDEFDGFDKLPIYHLGKDYDFWKAAHNILYALEKEYGDNEMQVGSKITLINKCQNQNLAYSHFGQGNCDYSIREPSDIPIYDFVDGESYGNRLVQEDIKKKIIAYGNENRKE